MKLKTIYLINIIFIFLFSFITHNIYKWCPSTFTAVLFPVNESIWEHLKMIFITTLFGGILVFFLLRKNKINYQNIILVTVMSSIINILIFLLIYTPLFYFIGYNFFITIFIYLITIIISQSIAYLILKINIHYYLLNFIALFFIPIIIFIFGYFTYNPPKWDLLFYDQFAKKYGIYNYYR